VRLRQVLAELGQGSTEGPAAEYVAAEAGARMSFRDYSNTTPLPRIRPHVSASQRFGNAESISSDSEPTRSVRRPLGGDSVHFSDVRKDAAMDGKQEFLRERVLFGVAVVLAMPAVIFARLLLGRRP